MVRKLFCAMFVMTVAVGFVCAEEFRASITKVDGNKVTFHKIEGKGKDAKKSDTATTLTVGEKATIAKGKGAKGGKVEVGDVLEGGLKNEVFGKIGDKGVGAVITTEGDGEKARITQILVVGGKKKKDAE